MTLRLYLDFDGTCTASAGADTVRNPVYQSLHSEVRYDEAEFKSQPIMRAILAKPTNTNLRLKPDVAEYLPMALSRNADIVIVSRNRREYIEAILSVGGLTDDEIEKIKIYDIRDIRSNYNSKGIVIANHEDLREKPANITVICDDDLNGLYSMEYAVKAVAGDKTNLLSYKGNPGEIDFIQIRQDIDAKLQADAEIKQNMPSIASSASLFFSLPLNASDSQVSSNSQEQNTHPDQSAASFQPK